MEKGAWDSVIFSIIVPVCNGEKYLYDSALSAIEQNTDFFSEGRREDLFEVLLVENGSKDNSPAICDELSDKYPHVRAIHLGKVGLFGARQAGIRKALGEYIISLDADDKLDGQALKELYECLVRHKDESASPDIIFYDAARLGGDGTRLHKRSFKPEVIYFGDEKRVFIRQLCRDDSINSMWTKCVKREIAQCERTDLFLNYGEDLYQTAEFLDRARSVIYLDKVLYLYRQDDASMTSTYSEIYLENEKETWKKLDEIASKWEKDAFTDIITRRKSLTCTIAVTRLISSRLSYPELQHKLDKLMKDPFYVRYSVCDLPDWAPEEAVFVKGLQSSSNPRRAITGNAIKNSIKTWIKERIKNGI